MTNCRLPRARTKVAIAGLLAAVLFAGSALVTNRVAQAATPSFVQGASNEVGSGTTNSVAFSQANTAGNLIAVYVVWNNSGAVTVADNRGNPYTVGAARTAWGNGWSSQIFYAKSIAGARTQSPRRLPRASRRSPSCTSRSTRAGQGQPGRRVRVCDRFGLGDEQRVGDDHECQRSALRRRRVDPQRDGCRARGSQLGREAFGNITEDRSSPPPARTPRQRPRTRMRWVMQLVAFRADAGSQPPPDTAPPSVPAGLTATAVSSTQVNLAWTAASDNVGVVGYTVYRNGSVLQPPSPTTTFQDTTAQPSTSYTYTVDAFDAAGLHSTQSTPAQVTTPAGGGSPSGLQAAYAFDEADGDIGNRRLATRSDRHVADRRDVGSREVRRSSAARRRQRGRRHRQSRVIANDRQHDRERLDLLDELPRRRRGDRVEARKRRIPTRHHRRHRVSDDRLQAHEQLRRQHDPLRQDGVELEQLVLRHRRVRRDGSDDARVPQRRARRRRIDRRRDRLAAELASERRRSDNGLVCAGFGFTGRIDNVRIYNTPLSAAQVQADMNAPLGTGGATDPQPPTVSITSPANNAVVNDIVTVTASATDNVGVAGVQFQIDGVGRRRRGRAIALHVPVGHPRHGQRTAHPHRPGRDAAGNVAHVRTGDRSTSPT